MSAFIVSRAHISVLVEACFRYEVPNLPEISPVRLGQLLWDENIRSVSYCYPGEPLNDLPGPIDETYLYDEHCLTDKLSDMVRNPYQVYKLARCYDYQSCEHPSYELSPPQRIIDALKRRIEQCLETNEIYISYAPAYKAAEWDI